MQRLKGLASFVGSFGLTCALALGCSSSSGNGYCEGLTCGGGPTTSPTDAPFNATFTGSLTSVVTIDGMDSDPDTVSVSWTMTQTGDAVVLGVPGCPAASGTASGDVITVGDTVCPESNSVNETYTGGTLTLEGDSLVVSIDLAVAGDGVSGTGTLTGTLTK